MILFAGRNCGRNGAYALSATAVHTAGVPEEVALFR